MIDQSCESEGIDKKKVFGLIEKIQARTHVQARIFTLLYFHLLTRVNFYGPLPKVGLVFLLKSVKTFVVLVIAVRVDDARGDEDDDGGEEEYEGEGGVGHERRLGLLLLREAEIRAVMVEFVENGKAGEGDEELYGCDQ